MHIPLSRSNVPGVQVNSLASGVVSVPGKLLPFLRPLVGASWELSSTGVGGFNTGTMSRNQNLYVIVGNGTTGKYSADGRSWTNFTLPIQAQYSAYNTSTGQWLFASYPASGTVNIARTSDLSTFSTSTLTISGSSNNRSLWYDAVLNKYAYFTYNQSSPYAQCATSTDGITWTVNSLPNFNNNIGWGYLAGNGYLIVFYYADDVLYYSNNGSSWTQRSVPYNAAYPKDSLDPATGTFFSGGHGTVGGFGAYNYATQASMLSGTISGGNVGYTGTIFNAFCIGNGYFGCAVDNYYLYTNNLAGPWTAVSKFWGSGSTPQFVARKSDSWFIGSISGDNFYVATS